MAKGANGSSVFLYLMAYIISYYSLTFLHLDCLLLSEIGRKKENKIIIQIIIKIFDDKVELHYL